MTDKPEDYKTIEESEVKPIRMGFESIMDKTMVKDEEVSPEKVMQNIYYVVGQVQEITKKFYSDYLPYEGQGIGIKTPCERRWNSIVLPLDMDAGNRLSIANNAHFLEEIKTLYNARISANQSLDKPCMKKEEMDGFLGIFDTLASVQQPKLKEAMDQFKSNNTY
ncbi:hypothetical protein EIN_377580 [Entamoeba invadens IP1]|uniref:Uncharacterized protein n=1 Tax=Entamoeba invadens IP1 TaxID=370355 RepID=A0A0A1TW47_ENTIV|nr:hypothetical protein EIN_377580 [Entamoeba invadens IP1]ELP83503.1 hypothetical protein EIN_377580 [Entamoeba invadens IP1]|eukprot:XP_004182849.1 hypothetical protein EIN_377580 [Entamoeba invadens IP1]